MKKVLKVLGIILGLLILFVIWTVVFGDFQPFYYEIN